MDIVTFAEMTYGVLKDTPLDKFIPTLCLPEQSQIHALANVPEDEDVRDVAINWAESVTAKEEEYLVAFRDGDGYFRVIRRANGELREALFPEKKRS